MIQNSLEPPEPITVECGLCGKPLRTQWHWVYDRWLRGTVHNQCAQDFDQRAPADRKPAEQPIPERFRDFQIERIKPEIYTQAAAFSPEAELHTLAILGPRATGKSRLMWATVKMFFDMLELATGAKRWVEYAIFPSLVTEQDRNVFAGLKVARYVFLDDIGCTESFGRDRANVQNLIRTRVQENRWTFLTIDDGKFDEGLGDLFRGRALVIYTL